MEGSWGSEMCVFAIIERPFVNITTGTNVPYMASLTLNSNYAFFPKIADAFTKSIALKTAMATELITKLATGDKGGLSFKDVTDILHVG